jgi:hypothetical protein
MIVLRSLKTKGNKKIFKGWLYVSILGQNLKIYSANNRIPLSLRLSKMELRLVSDLAESSLT